MNNATDGVTLFAGFISDLLANYKGKEGTTTMKPLFAMAETLDLANPTNLVPIKVYNRMCDWIEKNLGPANLRRAGEFVGKRAYNQMVNFKLISTDSTPLEIMKALVKVAGEMIRDPQKRGWEIITEEDKKIVMRRTQTFHPVLQEGLLKSMVEKSNVQFVRVVYLKSVAKGDEFDEYQITWRQGCTGLQ